MRLKFFLFLIIFLHFSFLFKVVDAQCPMCKQNVEAARKSDKKDIGNGLNTGILYLLIMPYVMVAGIGYYWYRSSKKLIK